MRTVRSLLLGLLLAASAMRASAQNTGGYEVASIRPNQSGARRAMGVAPGGRLTATNVTLKFLIRMAWDVRDYQIQGGPNWLDATGWDIEAKMEHPVEPTLENRGYFQQILRELLIERFQLAVKQERRELPEYALVVGRDGPKMKGVGKLEKATDMRVHGGSGEVAGEKLSMTIFTSEVLSEILGRFVEDKTGLTGYYDFKLTWTPEDSDTPGASIFTAIQEQLGLRLEAQKGPVEALVVEHAEKASAN